MSNLVVIKVYIFSTYRFLMKKEKRVEKIIAVSVTFLIVAILVLSGPAQAFSLEINADKIKVNKSESISFVASLSIDSGERLPVDYLSLIISGPENINCRFLVNGTPVLDCEKIKIEKILDVNSSIGNLTGNYSNVAYNWGYGYGYGDSGGFLSYNITLNTSDMPDGVYSNEFRAKISANQFFKRGGNFTIIVPINITDLAPAPLCVYEAENILASASISGSVKEVLVEVNDSGNYQNKTTTKSGAVYSAFINGAGGGNLFWRFVVKDIADGLNYGSWNSIYVNRRTSLSIYPTIPDGLNNWYVSEPVFTLLNSDASQIYYRWDGTGTHLYSSPFNLTDIPNPPPETAGILKLTWWSNTSCGIESEQNKTIYADLTAPRLSNFVPANMAVINNKNPSISAVIDDVYGENSGIDKNSVGMKVDSNSVARTLIDISSIKTKASFDAVNLSEGSHIVEVFGKDNAGWEFYENWSFSINSSAGFSLQVNLPEDQIYGNTQIKFNISTTSLVSRIDYIDNLDENAKFRTLCYNCKSFTRTVSFGEGQHNLTIRATDKSGNLKEENISFFIDSRAPKVISTKPKNNEVVNGSQFYIKYSEKNLKSIVLYYGNLSKTLSCPAGENKNCTIGLNLSDYDGQYIDYWFIVSDYLRNASSGTNRIKIDTSVPVLNVYSPLNSNYTRRVIFNVTTSEKVNLKYIDNSVLKPRWNNLCTDCNKYLNTRMFSSGNHKVIIMATDKAGNSVATISNFTIA